MKGELTMRALIILVITFAILATQFYWGVRKKKILGAIIPLVMTALFITISFLEKTAEYAITGIISVVAIIIAHCHPVPLSTGLAAGYRSTGEQQTSQKSESP